MTKPVITYDIKKQTTKHMKYLLPIILFFSLNCFAQNADNLLGTYMTSEQDGMIEIFKKDNKYFGKLIWTKTPGKLDDHNPDAKQKADKLVGKEILKNFDFDGKTTWHNGTIYDPKNGKTYNCKITRDDKGNLNVRGFIGISLIGRTAFWIKVK